MDFRKSKTDPQPIYSLSLQVREPAPGGGPVAEGKHHSTSKEGAGVAPLPEDPQEEQHGGEAAAVLLPVLHRVS